MNQNEELNKKTLAVKALIRFILGLIIVCSLLFIPAGTINYFNGWLYICSIFIPILAAFIYLFINDPELLEKRFKTKEKVKEQKLIQKIGIILVLVGFVLSGLDFRFRWSNVPIWLVGICTILVIGGYCLFIIVMRQNSYASRVIEVQENQKVIDYGLYSKIRHPMYLAAIIIMLSSSLVLGSYYSLIPMLLYVILIIFRIISEEEVLKKGLMGYNEYLKKVKYRLIPFVW